MALLDRGAILAAEDYVKESVEVPEWGGEVFVRVMSGSERDAFESQFVGQNGTGKNFQNIRARLATLTCCDDGGELLFGPADIIELGKKSAKALDRIFGVAMRLNGLQAEDVKALEKNSAATPAGSNGSG